MGAVNQCIGLGDQILNTTDRSIPQNSTSKPVSTSFSPKKNQRIFRCRNWTPSETSLEQTAGNSSEYDQPMSPTVPDSSAAHG